MKVGPAGRRPQRLRRRASGRCRSSPATSSPRSTYREAASSRRSAASPGPCAGGWWCAHRPSRTLHLMVEGYELHVHHRPGRDRGRPTKVTKTSAAHTHVERRRHLTAWTTGGRASHQTRGNSSRFLPSNNRETRRSLPSRDPPLPRDARARRSDRSVKQTVRRRRTSSAPSSTTVTPLRDQRRPAPRTSWSASRLSAVAPTGVV